MRKIKICKKYEKNFNLLKIVKFVENKFSILFRNVQYLDTFNYILINILKLTI